MLEAPRLRRLEPDRIAWPLANAGPVDVSGILERVRAEGDRALREIAASVGDPPPHAVPRDEWRAAYDSLPADLKAALHGASGRIRRFALAQRAALLDIDIVESGVRLGHRARAIARVGAYVPGGRYPLPSSLLMCAIPARVAGVANISVCTPRASPYTLAAAYIAEVDDVFEVGGAQAIAALAFGTALIPRVDLIVGPGNVYVTAAKRAVYGLCGIDGLAGPSELVAIASADADPGRLAANLLAQAEHDTSARVMLLAEEAALIDAVESELNAQIRLLATEAVAGEALARNGCAAVLPPDAAIEASNRLAPEHLELHGYAAERLASKAQKFGSLFFGPRAAAVFGDYGAGPNHVLPTNGTARFASGLSVFTFLVISTHQQVDGVLDPTLVEQTATLAAYEGLDAHRRSAHLAFAASNMRPR